MLIDLLNLARPERLPRLAPGVLLDLPAVRPNEEVVDVHFRHFRVHLIEEVPAQLVQAPDPVGSRTFPNRIRRAGRARLLPSRLSRLSRLPVRLGRSLALPRREFLRKAQSAPKDFLLERLLDRRLVAGLIGAEERQVVAEIEEIEKLLVLSRPEQVRAEPR